MRLPSLAFLQPLGRALMLPIAVLPVAGLLLRLGQPDMLDIAFVAAAGNAIFANLGLLFAIGVGVGLAREANGAAGLAGAVCYLVTVEGAKALLSVPASVAAPFTDTAARDLAIAAWRSAELAKLSVPAGILSGLVSGWLYNRYSTIRVPEYLAFFGGRRFVPIAAGGAGILGALVFGLGFPALEAAIDALTRSVTAAGPFGVFLYGLLNRLLIVTGLHHILNNVVWFILGDFHGATGDLKRFFAGDPGAGAFMSGFFPVMMFGLPAACLAMYHAAAPERRRAVGGMLLSLGLTSFLTGVTEPIEFTFMFLAPALYIAHALLTGLSMLVMDWLGVKLGFGFSAGLFDYVLNYGLATRPLLLLPVGAAYSAIYYAVFRFAIVRWNLPTPGREAAGAPAIVPPASSDERARAFVEALGGRGNLSSIEACTTRLRLTLVDPTAVDEAALRALGSRGLVRPAPSALQVVLGPDADRMAGEMRAVAAPPTPSPTQVVPSSAIIIDPHLAHLLGGDANVLAAERYGNRLRLKLAEMPDSATIQLLEKDFRGVAALPGGVLHLIAALETA